MSDLIKAWKDKQRATEKAEAWNDLPKGPKYMTDDSFAISLAHCKPPLLVRAGQQTCGGQNYWESPHELNIAILAYLTANWEKIWPELHEIMKGQEVNALIECQSHIDKMQNAINAARDMQGN